MGDSVNGVGDAKIWTKSGISERSTGPGYGRCDDPDTRSLEAWPVGVRKGARVWGTEAGVVVAKERAGMWFTESGLCKIRRRDDPGVHPWTDQPTTAMTPKAETTFLRHRTAAKGIDCHRGRW